jgi:hypothetical protein
VFGPKAAAVAAMAVLALAAAGCGGDDGGSGGGSDEDQVREIAQQLIDSDAAVCEKATDNFLDGVGGSKEECEEASKDGEGVDAEVKSVEIDGNEATASIDGERTGTIAFVMEDGDWKIDSLDDIERASEEKTETEAETEAETTAGSSEDKGEVTARAAADAFLSAVKSGDEAVICGLLDEEYAKQLTGASEFGVAECVEDLEGRSFGNVGASVKTTSVKLSGDEETGSVSLSNGKSIAVKWDGSRYVITRLGS